MLRWRLLLGIVLIAAVVGLCWLDYHATRPGIYLAVFAAALSLAATNELLAMMARQNLRPLAGVVYAGNLAIVASSALAASGWWNALERTGAPLWLLAIGLWPVVALAAAFVGEMRRYERPGQAAVNLACAAFALIYIGISLGVLAELRFLRGNAFGLWGLLTLVIVVKLGDIGAYTVGRLIGRHKMAPTLSPGKTWEGAAGAIAFSVFGAWLSITRFGPMLIGADGSPPIEPWFWLSYGAVVGVAGMIGDLAESLLKRDLGTKDSSRWMPGFGGVLDILDSLLLAAPIAYFFWLVLDLLGD